MKYIKSVLWIEAKRLFYVYIEDAQCLKVKKKEILLHHINTVQH